MIYTLVLMFIFSTAFAAKNEKNNQNFFPLNNISATDVPAMNNMVKIPGGTFIMGTSESDKKELQKQGIPPVDSEVLHTVTITEFELASTLVTQEMFEKLMGFNPSYFKGPRRPVDQVSWYEANEFCLRLSYVSPGITSKQKSKLVRWAGSAKNGRDSIGYRKAMTAYNNYAQSPEGKGLYKLPTEAQWEYAAKGGKQYLFGTFDGTISPENAVYNTGKTMEVATKKPNPFGLYDMCGNIWEWCADWFGVLSTNKAHNPKGLKMGDSKVIRGGSWFSPDFTRTAFRGDAGMTYHHCDIGFRQARY